jgi:hypothetical protein
MSSGRETAIGCITALNKRVTIAVRLEAVKKGTNLDTEPLEVKRSPVRLAADATLTITRLFWVGPERARKVVNRVMALDEERVAHLLTGTMQDFDHLHIDLEDIFLEHYEQAAQRIQMPNSLTVKRMLLIGAYFTMEYAFASSALFNPSIAPAIDQADLEPGSMRFAMSLRAVGEGHHALCHEPAGRRRGPSFLHHLPPRRRRQGR